MCMYVCLRLCGQVPGKILQRSLICVRVCKCQRRSYSVASCVCKCTRRSYSVTSSVCVCQTLSTKGKERCEMFSFFLLKQGAAGLSLTLRPTKTVIDRCVNVPARDAPGRNGRSWGSHMNPPLKSCINVGLLGRWAHDAHVWFFRFFRTCRMRLDDAVGDLLTSWGRIQVCFGQILSKNWS